MTSAGRPSDYAPEYAEQARKLCELGATDTDIANFFEVSDRTIYRWRIAHDEFCQALKTGKEIADERVERSLYQRAVGYEADDVHVSNYQGGVTLTPIKKHYPPDTTAAIFWLKNRRRDEWRDKHDHEHTGKDGGPIEFDDKELARRIALILVEADDSAG